MSWQITPEACPARTEQLPYSLTGIFMDINIHQQPPLDIPRIRWRYTRLSLLFLGLIICSVIIGAASLFLKTGHDEVVQYTVFVSFLVFGFAFVYFAEKLMGYRRLGSRQQEELRDLRRKYREIEEYCRNVSDQGRYLVVEEFDAIVAYVDKVRDKEPAPKV